MKQVPDDHWIYDEGASITFIAPTPGPGALISRPQPAAPGVAKGVGKLRPNATATRLLEALHEARRGTEAMSGDEVPGLIELEDGEEVEWVASTCAHEQLINLFVCRAEGEPETVLATEHGDRGVVQSVDGAWGLWRPPRPLTGACQRGGRTCEAAAAGLENSAPTRPATERSAPPRPQDPAACHDNHAGLGIPGEVFGEVEGAIRGVI